MTTTCTYSDLLHPPPLMMLLFTVPWAQWRHAPSFQLPLMRSIRTSSPISKAVIWSLSSPALSDHHFLWYLVVVFPFCLLVSQDHGMENVETSPVEGLELTIRHCWMKKSWIMAQGQGDWAKSLRAALRLCHHFRCFRMFNSFHFSQAKRSHYFWALTGLWWLRRICRATAQDLLCQTLKSPVVLPINLKKGQSGDGAESGT